MPKKPLTRPKSISPDVSVFDQMAQGWYNFRHYTIFKTELEFLARVWQAGSLLNVGCGHGADFLPFKDNFQLTGIDFSPEMISLAHKYAAKFKFQADLRVADARDLPFADCSFDWAIAVATYHHLQGRESQLRALRDLLRVLKPGGEAFITVWNRCQPRFWRERKEAAVPWRAAGKTIFRYYYLFTYPEIESLVRDTGFVILKSAPESTFHFPLKYFSRNICLTLQKPV